MSKAIITVAGKGGVGKTSISAAMIRQLLKSRPEARILAIDADPAEGLSTALAVESGRTVDDIRRDIVNASLKDRTRRRSIELLGEARYQLLNAMAEERGFAFLAVGRPEAAGCYCGVNAYLKEVISALSEEFDYVVIDGEAGIEQINRRVMEKVTHLILVSDTSRKGTKVTQKIKAVADELMMYEKLGLVINRCSDESVKALLDTGGLPVSAYIPDDGELARFDAEGRSVLELPDSSNLVLGVRRTLEAIDIL